MDFIFDSSGIVGAGAGATARQLRVLGSKPDSDRNWETRQVVYLDTVIDSVGPVDLVVRGS